MAALMLLLTTSLLSFTAPSNAVSHKHHRYSLDDIVTLEARKSPTDSPFAVLGVGSVGSDAIHPRLEIRELERNRDQCMWPFLNPLLYFLFLEHSMRFSIIFSLHNVAKYASSDPDWNL
jgi:hypothetical protein